MPPHLSSGVLGSEESTRPILVSGPQERVSQDERKTITALFADIKGSTELMETLDPEEARTLVDPALQLMIEAARRYDGYIVQSTGDGIFALFGAPIAREEHAHRALYAALRMQGGIRDYAARLRAEGRPPIEIRVGVNTGQVVVRSIRTSEDSAEYTPIGHSTNLASRLQTIAPTGSVVAGASTARLAAGYFDFRPMGPIRVKGISEAVEAFEVTGFGPLRTRLEVSSALRGLTRFVGRTEELQRLRHALDLAESRNGRVLAVTGEAGLGKSRLFYEFKAIVRGGCLILETFVPSHGASSPWLPIVNLLNEYFGIRDADDARVRREKVTGRVLTLNRTLEPALPYIFSLLSVQESPDALAQMDAGIRRERMMDAIIQILLNESTHRPLLLIVEDLHWADSSSLELLSRIAKNIDTASILMLVNYRPEFSHGWAAYSYYEELRLEPLVGESAEQFITSLLPDGSDENRELARLKSLIVERTSGNPFFIEEMVHSLFEQGVLSRNGHLMVSGPVDDLLVPATVEDILASRIDRLSPPQKEVLQTVSIIGRDFTFELAHRVLTALAAHLGRQISHDEFQEMLDSLDSAGFIYQQSDEKQTFYRFKHALTQAVAYGSVLNERRRLLHGVTADCIESVFAGALGDHLEELAHHYERSGNASKAVMYLMRAGEQAARRLAYDDAINHLNAARTIVERMPAGEHRDRQDLAIHSALGQYLIPLKSPASDEVRQAFDRALELSQRLGEVEPLFWVGFGLQYFYLLRFDLKTARSLGERQLAIAERLNDPAKLAAACSALAQTLLAIGEFVEAGELCERGVRVGSYRHEFPLGDLGDPLPLMLANSATVLVLLGYPDRAMARVSEALEAARRSGPYPLAFALNVAARTRHRMRDAESAVRYALELGDLAADRGFPLWAAEAKFVRGAALVDLGQVDDALVLLHESAVAYEKTGATAGLWRIPAAEAYSKLGDDRRALVLLDETEVSMRSTAWESDVHRVRGEVILHSGRVGREADAEASFREAIRVAQSQNAKILELRSTVSLANLLASLERDAEAQSTLAPCYEWFSEGFSFRDLIEARDLLASLKSASASSGITSG